jgi:hypothetical protein
MNSTSNRLKRALVPADSRSLGSGHDLVYAEQLHRLMPQANDLSEHRAVVAQPANLLCVEDLAHPGRRRLFPRLVCAGLRG